jgi:hypothetical protein
LRNNTIIKAGGGYGGAKSSPVKMKKKAILAQMNNNKSGRGLWGSEELPRPKRFSMNNNLL